MQSQFVVFRTQDRGDTLEYGTIGIDESISEQKGTDRESLNKKGITILNNTENHSTMLTTFC